MLDTRLIHLVPVELFTLLSNSERIFKSSLFFSASNSSNKFVVSYLGLLLNSFWIPLFCPGVLESLCYLRDLIPRQEHRHVQHGIYWAPLDLTLNEVLKLMNRWWMVSQDREGLLGWDCLIQICQKLQRLTKWRKRSGGSCTVLRIPSMRRAV